MFEVIQLKLIKFLDYAFVKFKAEEDHQVALDPKTFANLDVHLNIKVRTKNHSFPHMIFALLLSKIFDRCVKAEPVV